MQLLCEISVSFFFFKQKTAYDIGLGIPAEPLFRSSNVPNPDEAVPSFVSGAMAKAGKGLLEGTLQAGTSAVSDKLLKLVKDFLKVRCRLALLPFLISCLIWLDLDRKSVV